MKILVTGAVGYTLEAKFYPGVKDIVAVARKLMKRRKKLPPVCFLAGI